MTDQRAITRAAVAVGMLLAACGTPTTGDDEGGQPGGGRGGDPPLPASFEVALVRNAGDGVQRVSFAIPLPAGGLADAGALAIFAGTAELPAARRALARYADGSPRSVQVQVDVDPAASPVLRVELGTRGAEGVEAVDVETTLLGIGGDREPRVWALLPPELLAASGLVGSIKPHTADAWASLCDYDRWDTSAFLAAAASRDVWLYDRVTAMYRGYAITGELSPLRSAYREAGIYRAGLTIIGGVVTALGVPTASDDLKYHYSQGLALHYLLTGDDRFREAAEAISARVAGMWNPSYDGGDRFWTERHAGFALLAHEWAARVTDDRAADIEAHADEVATAVFAAQAAAPAGSEPDARCFTHTAAAHGEDFGTVGCSPWMSAILADGLDAHAARVGGERAAEVDAALAKLGRAIARHGRDANGRPYYWMAFGGAPELDEYDEHWGESAYVTALAWRATGRQDDELRTAADELLAGLRDRGEVGQLRSFNWQCRSAVATPALLQ